MQYTTYSLNKAYEVLVRFLQNCVTEQEKAGTIQAFEFCYELAWKTMKKALKVNGLEVNSPRETFREAADNKIIENPKKWFLYMEKRNLTTHTYNPLIMEEIIIILPEFVKDLGATISNINLYLKED